MNAEDLKMGRVYRAKKPSRVLRWPDEFVNDRAIIWVGASTVQYDGPSVGHGRHYPTVPKEKFLAWAGQDVTEEMPKGEWMDWNIYLSHKKFLKKAKPAA